MKKFKLVGLAAIMSLLTITTSCNKDEGAMPENQIVPEGNELINKILSSKEVVDFNSSAHGGNLLKDKVSVEKITENGTVKAAILTIPIDTNNDSNEIKGLFVDYDYVTGKSYHAVIGFAYDGSLIQKAKELKDDFGSLGSQQMKDAGIVFNASYNLYNLAGELEGQHIFKDNKTQFIDHTNDSKNIYKDFCIFNCIVANMSNDEKLACGMAIVECISLDVQGCINDLVNCSVSAAQYQPYCREICGG